MKHGSYNFYCFSYLSGNESNQSVGDPVRLRQTDELVPVSGHDVSDVESRHERHRDLVRKPEKFSTKFLVLLTNLKNY